jgi:FixJ family two-component response regulator
VRDEKKLEMRFNSPVAIVDDDQASRLAALSLVGSMGYEVVGFVSAMAFIEALRSRPWCAVIADVRMPGIGGVGLLLRLAEVGPPLPVILITAFPDEITRVSAREAGAVCYLAKPFDPAELMECLRRSATQS